VSGSAEPVGATGREEKPVAAARRRTPWYWRAPRFLLRLIVVAFLLIVGCNTMSTALVDRVDRNVERDENGIMSGAADRTLGSPDSPNAVLFVHGYAGGTDNFNRLPQQLADAGWFVRVIRLPGHGTTPRDMEKIKADELIQAVRAESQKLNQTHQRVVLVGHSMGGAISTIVAAEGNIDALILGGAYFGITDRWYYGFSAETWTRFSSRLLRWVYKGDLFLQVNDKSAKRYITSYTWLPTKSGIMLMDIGNRAKAPELLAKITCPVLMLHSHGDIAAAPEAAEASFAAMASANKKLIWLDRSNHHVFWDFDHETLEAETLRFLTSIP